MSPEHWQGSKVQPYLFWKVEAEIYWRQKNCKGSQGARPAAAATLMARKKTTAFSSVSAFENDNSSLQTSVMDVEIDAANGGLRYLVACADVPNFAAAAHSKST